MTQRIGIDISRYDGRDPLSLLVRQMDAHNVDVVLDIGANAGRYANDLRHAGYTRRIVSFEPLSSQFSVLKRQSDADDNWEAFPYALGEQNGTATLNVAANAGESSSILPMLKAHEDSAPAAKYIGTEDVQIRTLDSLAAELFSPGNKVFIKADVQGYENSVLAGAKSVLNDHCVGLQLELSLVPLYEGGMLYREAIDVAESIGFSLTGLIPGFTDPRSGRLMQADGIFFRDTEKA
nr:FkbM family methyltransferase [Mycobacterium sp. E740]